MKKNSVALMATIAAAMTAAPGYHLATAAEAKELIDAGFAEQNPEITEGDKIATRLTEAGQAEAAKANGGNAGGAPASTASASKFEIEDGIALPSARGGKGGSVYPFDSLNVGQSFHVPATTDRPNPAKSLASTVSSATKRYADKPEGERRKFTVRSVGTDDPKGAGARVWREA